MGLPKWSIYRDDQFIELPKYRKEIGLLISVLEKDKLFDLEE